MDTFTEELVVKKNTSKDTMKLVAYLLGLLAIPAICVLLINVNVYFAIVAICAGFFCIYAAYYLITGMYVEYEYAVTNSNITIDKIIAKRNRKRIISVDIKRFNSLKKLSESNFEGKSYKKIFKASITQDGKDVYGAEMHLDKFGGDCLLLFSPGEKTLEAIRPHLKNTIKIELFKNSIKKSSPKPSENFSAGNSKPVSNKPKNNPVKKTSAESNKPEEHTDKTSKEESKKTKLKKEKSTDEVKKTETDSSAGTSRNGNKSKKKKKK